MKKLFLITGVFAASLLMIPTQELIGSLFHLSKQTEHNGTSAAITETGVITLETESNRLNIKLPLFAILSSPADNDSITNLHKNINLEFSGEFPENNLKFHEIDNDKKAFSVDGKLTVNGITKNATLNFDLFKPTFQEGLTSQVLVTPARMSFMFEFNPADFALDFETAQFTKMIKIETGNGVINLMGTSPQG